ncbi:peptide ABC transporter substrate-binding protein [Bradyrhizobium sp. NC92]|uniref:peptide ABC transporter substrate-binding protein n=1 Tax=Bradyrhizobium sp. (strain NC92) TaxID=55395 RepID=UPI0021AB0A9E|nr:peptide ABC transporter substrate-binding protein [Bradyrhizobium sp. NC92]UWU67981.1 peptide ABC transporter substrate-binding protein [Bradyrhizobium sp. NC92]
MSKLNSLLALGAAATLVATVAVAAPGRSTQGTVNIIYWQAPSMLNPYLASGDKDADAASLVLEPLALFDENAKLSPRLAVDIPTVENGGVSNGSKSITWKLRPGLKWSDGSPVTAKDVVFTANYCMNPKAGCQSLNRFRAVDSVEAADELTIKVTFSEMMPDPYGPFVGERSPVIQAKQFSDCLGEKASTCTDANFNPIGTGPFVVTSFKPNDAIQLKANPNYRDPNKPAFAEVNYKGGGDALGAARAVLQTGEYDIAWNPVVAPDVLKKMEEAGKGKLSLFFGTTVETLVLNLTDPSSSLPPEERSSAKHPNPFLSDVRVRKALSMALDRATLTKIGYDFMGKPTCDIISAPELFAAGNTNCLKQDIKGAQKLLDEAGWNSGSDGIRERKGKRLKLTFQTSTNAVRQQLQAIIKQWWREIGVDVELRNINASVFFSSDPGNPDTYQKFYADVEMFTFISGIEPGTFVAGNTCDKAPRADNQWRNTNYARYCDKDYDSLVVELGKTTDLERRAQIFKKLNNMLTVDSNTYLPLVWRAAPMAVSNTLGGVIFPWDSPFANIQDWYRKK